MLMSLGLISDSAIGCPSPGPSAIAMPEPSASAKRAAADRCLGVNMFDLPVAVDRPAGDAVVVLVREAQHVRDLLGFAARSHKLSAGRLHVAGLVPGAALQHGGAAIPAPGDAEPGEGLGEHRRLQRRLPPAIAAV